MNGFEQLASATQTRPVIGIVGGAVAGSEAAALCAKLGAISVVVDQGERPFGKIEDGLPRWHHKLRDKEYVRIGENLRSPNVLYVPKTEIGTDTPWDFFYKELGLSAVVLANGAWRDRPFPVEGAEAHSNQGLIYQNPFVYWFNHYPDRGYDGPTYDIVDDAVVVGGGLASIDVVKIINLELYARAMRKRGIEIDITELEVKGIPRILESHGLTREELGIKGCTLYYRRRKEDMPLASGNTSDPALLAKLQNARVKIMDRVERKYLVNFKGLHRPIKILTEGNKLVGLRFARTQIVDGRPQDIIGESVDIATKQVISSIGSVPSPIAGVPTKGELYDFADWTTGEIKGLPGVFGLGNVLTGQGNIRDSRKNAIEITESVLGPYLGIGELINESVEAAVARPSSSAESQHSIAQWIEGRWESIGYDSYDSWLKKQAT